MSNFKCMVKISNSKCPCYRCDNRSITCHDYCKKYIDWKQARDILRDIEAKERAFRQEFNSFKESAIKKVRNNKR